MMIALIAVLAFAAGSYAGIPCHPTYYTVCGYDLKTYSNSCDLGTTPILHSGRCKPLTTKICGSDGVTYPNIAVFNRVVRANPNLTMNVGGCSSNPIIEINGVCQLEYDPVCGYDDRTYINACFFREATNTTVPFAHYGECGYIVCGNGQFYDIPAAKAANITEFSPFIRCVAFTPPYDRTNHLRFTSP